MIAATDSTATRGTSSSQDAPIADAFSPSLIASFLDNFVRANADGESTLAIDLAAPTVDAASGDSSADANEVSASGDTPTDTVPVDLADTLAAMAMPLLIPQFMPAPVALAPEILGAGAQADAASTGPAVDAAPMVDSGAAPAALTSQAAAQALVQTMRTPVAALPQAVTAAMPPPVTVTPPPAPSHPTPPLPEGPQPLAQASTSDEVAAAVRNRVRAGTAEPSLPPASTRPVAEGARKFLTQAVIGDALPTVIAASGGQSTPANAAAGSSPAAVDAAPQDPEALRAALGERLQLQAARGQERAVIRLDPPMMGTVEIVIRHEGGALQVHVSATHGEVARQLQQMGEQLRQDLVSRHYGEVTVQISDRSLDADGRQRQPRDTAPEARVPGRALRDTTDLPDASRRFSLLPDAELA